MYATLVLFLGLSSCGQTKAAITPTPARSGSPAIRPSRPSSLLLVLDERIQKELKLEALQKERIRNAYSAWNRRAMELLDRENRLAKERGEVRKPFGVDMTDFQEQVQKILSPGQRRRLAQLQLQVRGLRAASAPEFQEQLNLSPDQVSMIEETLKDCEQAEQLSLQQAQDDERGRLQELDEVMASGAKPPKGSTWADLGNKVSEAHGKVIEQTVIDRYRREAIALNYVRKKVLSRKQWQTWLKKMGEPFDFDAASKPEEPQEAATPRQR